ncbi:MAG: 3-oxoacyl-ACP reductase FabG [Candidatus Aegiribacteria sp.]|nr:3-oxoacyl-ACP reductase FabG [Candidatus Aegiribacteria sp.]
MRRVTVNRLAVVTGAARGIGFSISEKLINSGWSVAGCDVLEDELSKRSEQLGDHFSAWVLDITDEDAVNETAGRIEKELGPVFGLVNNAGIIRDGLIMRMKKTDWDAVLNVNLTGAFLMCRAFSRGMLRQKEGSIVNISSIVALLGVAGQANYASTKAGLIGLTRALCREFAARNIRVNAIAPGFIETEMTSELSDEVREDYASRVPMKRMGLPGNVADAVHFLLDDVSAYITGVVLPVDGGLTT